MMIAMFRGTAFSSFSRDNKCSDCSVILISIDTLRADHLGCYGYGDDTSPHIDKFAKDSVLFKETIVQAPSTLPSHASIFTSLIPSHHGAFFALKTNISEDAVMMSEIFQKHGYRTVSYNGGGQVDGKFGFYRGFDVYESMGGNFDVHVDKAIEWLENNPDEKYFMFLHTYEVHHPYTPKKVYLDLFEDGYDGNLPMDISKDLLKQINQKNLVIDDRDREHIIDTYNAEIYSMDAAFGRLITFLKKENLYDGTVIIFTSDHGEEFGEHGWMGWHSHTLYDELLRVPLIIKFPNQKRSGKTVKMQVRSIDILPTLLDIVDIPSLETFEGVSLIGFKGKEELYAISQRDTPTDTHPISVRTSKWKLYDNLLFDLEKDPQELQNITNPSIFGELEYVKKYILSRGVTPSVQEIELHKELIEDLKSLGYINQ
jgi:arylsulfatase A-like enzyme